MKLTVSSSSKYFRKAASDPIRRCSPICVPTRSSSLSPAPHWARSRRPARCLCCRSRSPTRGGVCRARRRARRPDPQRARAPRSPCVSPLLAERVSPLNHQHKTDPHGGGSCRGQDPQPWGRHCGGLLQDAWRRSWHGAVQRHVRCTEGAHLRRAERPARCCPVAAALRGADLFEPDRPLVVGVYAPGQ